MDGVYLIINEWQYDSGEHGLDVIAFKNYDTALEQYYKDVDMAKCDFENVTSNYEEEESDYDDAKVFTIYENGEYCFNHINVKLVYKKLRVVVA